MVVVRDSFVKDVKSLLDNITSKLCRAKQLEEELKKLHSRVELDYVDLMT